MRDSRLERATEKHQSRTSRPDWRFFLALAAWVVVWVTFDDFADCHPFAGLDVATLGALVGAAGPLVLLAIVAAYPRSGRASERTTHGPMRLAALVLVAGGIGAYGAASGYEDALQRIESGYCSELSRPL